MFVRFPKYLPLKGVCQWLLSLVIDFYASTVVSVARSEIICGLVDSLLGSLSGA